VLSIKLLGGFEAHFQSGESIPPIGRKAQALLAYLAIAPGTPQPREKLTGLLWSDRGEAQARSSLRQALSELRKALAGAEPPPLETTGEAVSLAADAVVVDADVLGRLIDGGERPSLESAVELYRGDLLDGIAAPDPAFEDWLRDARRETRELACQAMARLLDMQSADGEAEAALATARRLVALDPLQESAHRTIMGLHAARGERSLALKQYQACRDLLREELGVEPDRETERLHEEIKREDQSGHETPAEPAPPVKPAIAVLPFDNLSGDPEQAYFADGMTRALITELGRLPNLAVMAAASTFAYEGRRVTVAEVSRDLGARYVVEGGIQKSGRRFRVTAQMTDAETGRQIWGDRFDGDLGDIFEIQDELTKQICGHLYLPLLEHRYSPRPGTSRRRAPTATISTCARSIMSSDRRSRARRRPSTTAGAFSRWIPVSPWSTNSSCGSTSTRPGTAGSRTRARPCRRRGRSRSAASRSPIRTPICGAPSASLRFCKAISSAASRICARPWT
jgi:TolB-like protein